MVEKGLLAQLSGLGFTLAHPRMERKNMSPLYGGWVDERVESSRDPDLQPSCPHSEDMIKAPCDPPLKRWEETADWPSAWHVQL